MSETKPLLDLSGVSKTYPSRRRGFFGLGPKRLLRALDDVTLQIRDAEVMGLVGESGSGKSTLGRLIVGLEKPNAGTITFSPSLERAARLEEGSLSALMVFQNPVGSLNPRQKVKEIIAEPLRVHGRSGSIGPRVADLMNQVGLSAAFAERRPHELSGGQAQRVGIARALALDPQLLVCDEPISALDVSIQAQVLNLFADLQARTGCSYLFISHDLPVVERLSHRVAIMYLGRIVETAETGELFRQPNHPYTRALIESAPRLETTKRAFRPVEGEIPSPLDPPPGCHFHPRCPFAFDKCRHERPALRQIAPGHLSACHLNG